MSVAGFIGIGGSYFFGYFIGFTGFPLMKSYC